MRGLLNVQGSEGVRALVDVLGEVPVQSVDGLDVLLLAEDGEDRGDALVQQQVQGRFPVLVDPVGMQAGVNADHNVGLFDPVASDVSEKKE